MNNMQAVQIPEGYDPMATNQHESPLLIEGRQELTSIESATPQLLLQAAEDNIGDAPSMQYSSLERIKVALGVSKFTQQQFDTLTGHEKKQIEMTVGKIQNLAHKINVVELAIFMCAGGLKVIYKNMDNAIQARLWNSELIRVNKTFDRLAKSGYPDLRVTQTNVFNSLQTISEYRVKSILKHLKNLKKYITSWESVFNTQLQNYQIRFGVVSPEIFTEQIITEIRTTIGDKALRKRR